MLISTERRTSQEVFLQSALQLDLWPLLENATVEASALEGVWHTSYCDKSPRPEPAKSHRFSQMMGMWCPCLANPYGPIIRNAAGSIDADRVVALLVTFLLAGAETLSSELSENPTLEAYRLLEQLTSLTNGENFHSTRALRRGPGDSPWTQVLTDLYTLHFPTLRQEALTPALHLWNTQEAVAEFRSITYLQHLPPAAEQRLVGIFRTEDFGYRTASDFEESAELALNNVMDAAQVWRPGFLQTSPGSFFHVLPVDVYECLLQMSTTGAGLNVQSAPYDPSLDLSEVAALWDIGSGSALASLANACEAARRL